MAKLAENDVEEAALAWLSSIGWSTSHNQTWRRKQRISNVLAINDSAVRVLGDETLRKVARELVQTVRNNVTIDWTLRENVRAKLRVLVKRTLSGHGYPPDKQEKATLTVLEQAEVLSEEWAN